MATSEMFTGTGGPANTEAGGSDPLTDTAQLWTGRKAKAEELKENHQADWTRFWRWYMAWIKPMGDPADWWRSNAPDPEAFKVIETLLPKHILGMFQKQEWFTVQGREAGDEAAALKVQALLTYMADAMDLFPKLYECIKYTLIMGHSWGKVTWRIETEDVVRDVGVIEDDGEGGMRQRNVRMVDKREVYNDPDFDWVMNDKIWADPTGKGRWYIEAMDTTLEELQETQDQLGIYKNLSLISQHGSRSHGEAFDEQQDGLRIPRENTEPAMSDGQKVSLLQCWGWVPPELRGPDGNAWRLTVIANGMVEIRDEPVPTPDNRPPYFPIKAIPIPGRLYGDSVLRWIGPQIDLKSKLANMRMDEVSLGVWQQYVYDREAVTSNQMLFQPGGAIPVDTQGLRSIRDVFAVVDRRPVLGEAYAEDATRQKIIEDTSAATPGQQGVADTSRQTATEIATITARGDQRFILSTMWLDHTVKKEILSRGFKYYQKQLPPGRLVRITGPFEGQVPIDINEIQMPLDIDVKAGIEAFGREARLQATSTLIQLTGSEAFAPWLKPGEIIKSLAEDQGWTNVNRFVKLPQEVQQEQQAAQQAQVQQAQMQAALETQSKMAVEQMKAQASLEAQQQQLQIEAAKAQMELESMEDKAEIDEAIAQRELEMKRVEAAIKTQGLSDQLAYQRDKMALDLEFLRKKGEAAVAATRAQAAARPNNDSGPSSK